MYIHYIHGCGLYMINIYSQAQLYNYVTYIIYAQYYYAIIINAKTSEHMYEIGCQLRVCLDLLSAF